MTEDMPRFVGAYVIESRMRAIDEQDTSEIEHDIPEAPPDPVQEKLISDLQLVRGIGCVTNSFSISSRTALTAPHRPRTARQLVNAGCTSLADLHKPKYNDMLTQAMRKGLRFMKHLNEPVTREQAEITLVRPFFLLTNFGNILAHLAHKKFIQEHISPKFDVLLAGS